MFLNAEAYKIQENPSILTKAINSSQHCQRNFDLEKQIPEKHMKQFIHAVTECPSKQNVGFYEAHFITNRDVIEAMHDTTKGFSYPKDDGNGGLEMGYQTNSQVLANLVVVFTKVPIDDNLFAEEEGYDAPNGGRTEAGLEWKSDEGISDMQHEMMLRDQQQAIGIAAGYLNVTAALLGYGTGCCACFDPNDLRKAGNFKNEPALMMGIGFRNAKKNRRIHHADDSFVFPTYKKQKIGIHYVR